jgi:hypothetical protein
VNHGLWTRVWFTSHDPREFQFDTVINDRSIILRHYQNFIQYYYNNSTIKILNWEFFVNRFDILSIEPQINIKESGCINKSTEYRWI